MTYRLTIDIRYSNVSNANSAVSAINTTLSNAGRSETATRTGSDVSLLIVDIPDQDTAIALRDALTDAWSSAIRSYGKASISKTEDMS